MQEDVLLQDANVVDSSGQSTIPGNWSEGATCTAWGCYLFSDTCAYLMEQTCTIPVTTVASKYASAQLRGTYRIYNYFLK